MCGNVDGVRTAISGKYTMSKLQVQRLEVMDADPDVRDLADQIKAFAQSLDPTALHDLQPPHRKPAQTPESTDKDQVRYAA